MGGDYEKSDFERIGFRDGGLCPPLEESGFEVTRHQELTATGIDIGGGTLTGGHVLVACYEIGP